VVCKHALFRVEVGPSGEEETQTGGEFKGVGGGEDEEAAGFDDASQMAEDAEGVEAVFERFDKEGGVECGIREGEWLLEVSADNGHGSLLKALQVEVEAEDGVSFLSKREGEGTFAATGIKDKTLRRQQPAQKIQNSRVCCAVGVASH